MNHVEMVRLSAVGQLLQPLWSRVSSGASDIRPDPKRGSAVREPISVMSEFAGHLHPENNPAVDTF